MESITLELRPRLRSCNAFISLRNTVEPELIQLTLNENVMILRVEDVVHELLLSSVRIIPKSLSLLRVSGNWVSFRVQTKPADSAFGSFGSEVVDGAGVEGVGAEKSRTTDSSRLPRKNGECTLHCAHCTTPVSRAVRFEKILPLPSSECDPSEWFCCGHDGDDLSKALSPRESDYFYGSHYSLLHGNVIAAGVKPGNGELICGRCLAVVGLRQADGSAKVWNCRVQLRASDGPLGAEANMLGDFFAVVRESMNAAVAGEQLLLEACEGGRAHCALLRPMDRRLDLLVEPADLRDDALVALKRASVVKLLYRYGETEAELVPSGTELQRCRVALPLLLAGLEHLLSSTKRFPPTYRSIDQFYVGYLDA